RLRVRARQPRVGAGSEQRRGNRRGARPGDLRRRAPPRSLRHRAAYPCEAVALSKLLVAKRGEIALPGFSPAAPLRLSPVAVAAPDDSSALHARSADETVDVTSYLDAADLVRAAGATGADAVHPGYGFLAENADFAAAVVDAGLVWIGPPATALRAGGDKLE